MLSVQYQLRRPTGYDDGDDASHSHRELKNFRWTQDRDPNSSFPTLRIIDQDTRPDPGARKLSLHNRQTVPDSIVFSSLIPTGRFCFRNTRRSRHESHPDSDASALRSSGAALSMMYANSFMTHTQPKTPYSASPFPSTHSFMTHAQHEQLPAMLELQSFFATNSSRTLCHRFVPWD